MNTPAGMNTVIESILASLCLGDACCGGGPGGHGGYGVDGASGA